MKNFVILLFTSFVANVLIAQQDSVKYNWGVYGEDSSEVLQSDSIIKLETKELTFKNIGKDQPGKTKVSSPIEIKTISDEIKALENPEFKGYRVQVMLSQNKNDVLKAQSSFLRFNKDVEVYIDRKAPNYRLRVGDFYNKFDAFAFQKKIDSEYPNSLVVSDQVNLPKLQEKEVELEDAQNETE